MEKLSLKAIRVMKNLSADEMAKLLGISKQAYYQKENGKRGLTAIEFAKILDFTGLEHNQVKL